MIDYFATHLWQAWAIVAVACLVLELTNGGLYIICFAVGGALAALVAPFSGWIFQVCTFIAVSAISIFFLRPLAQKYFHKESRVSNADAIIGRIGRVSEAIPNGGYGRVALDGDDWKAECVEKEDIPVGTPVKVVSRESIIIKVTKEID